MNRKGGHEHHTTASGNEGVGREGHPIVDAPIRTEEPARRGETIASAWVTRNLDIARTNRMVGVVTPTP